MDINLVFLLNALFIFFINLLNFYATIILSIILIFILGYKKKSKKIILFSILIITILSINYKYKTVNKVEKNQIYQFEVNVISEYPRLVKIDNKYTKNKYNITFDKVVEDGDYKILGEVKSKYYNFQDKSNKLEVKILEKQELRNKVKENLKYKIENLVGEFSGEFRNFTNAVLLGNKSELSDNIREKFNYTGTSHILVVSGLHIGIIILSILFILKRLPYQIRYFVTAIVLTLYCYGIGFTPSVLRAYIMGMIFLCSKIFYEERDMIKAIMIAFIVSNFINPYSIRSISYQMSYLALVAILFLFPKVKEYLKEFQIYRNLTNLNNYKKYIVDFLLLSLTIQAMLTPIFLYNFRSLPLFSFIPNLIVIPLGSILVQGLFVGLLLSYLNLGFILMPLCYYLYSILIFIVSAFSKIPLLTLSFYSKISLGLYVFLYVIIFLFILLKKEVINKKYIFLIIGLIIGLLVFLNLRTRNENLNLPNNLGYYRTSPNKVLILNKRLKIRDIYLLKDYKIRNLDYIITPYKIRDENIDLKEAFPDVEKIRLGKDEGIKLDSDYFYNENNWIKLEEN